MSIGDEFRKKEWAQEEENIVKESIVQILKK
jgi:hypothetical protein